MINSPFVLKIIIADTQFKPRKKRWLSYCLKINSIQPKYMYGR